MRDLRGAVKDTQFCAKQGVSSRAPAPGRLVNAVRLASRDALRRAHAIAPDELFYYSFPVGDFILLLTRSSNALAYDFCRFVSGPVLLLAKK